jgi:hypothetical protein
VAYVLLGSRIQTGVSDAQADAQVNPFRPKTGWDVIFHPNDLATNITVFEVYQISLDGPVGSSGAVLIDGHIWNYVGQFWRNSYDPQQPLILKQTQTLQFCWDAAFTSPPYNQSSNIQPVVTIWLRYDPAVGVVA